MTQSAPPEWTVQDLSDRLGRGDRFFVLDVRNRDEFESTRIEGRTPLETKNVPYFEMLESADGDDLVASVEQYVKAYLTKDLPTRTPLLAVCGKGGTSRLVAEALHRLGYPVSNLAGGMAAWGDFYESRTAAQHDGVTVTQICRPARGCLSYLIVSDGRAAVVDPGRHVDRYLDVVAKHAATIAMVIDTHAHADHVSGARALAAFANVPYYLHPYDAIHPIDLVPATYAYEPLRDRGQLTVGQARIEPIWIPGHTLGSVALLIDQRYLLAADSIFVRSIARPDLGGRAETWTPLHYHSIRRLLELPATTLVLPGHFSRPDEADENGLVATTLRAVRQENDGVMRAMGDGERFAEYIIASLPQFPQQYVDIKRINAGLLEIPDEQLAELETGRNQCAMSVAP
jgi:glyoxylase-like metal-dependent hydrolase (beta-lactamase superfamily II)